MRRCYFRDIVNLQAGCALEHVLRCRRKERTSHRKAENCKESFLMNVISWLLPTATTDSE
jgi:hypothetical protein